MSVSLFDIIGPRMIGPSSSHTAGAVRIGQVGNRLVKGKVKAARVTLYGSFAETGRGHGTDTAIVAGILGVNPDQGTIRYAKLLAKEADVDIPVFFSAEEPEHPNTARLELVGKSGGTLCVEACSLGGGRIMVMELNGLRVKFSGDLPTLIVQNSDRPGMVGKVAGMLAEEKVNIAALQVYRDYPGGKAVMIVETDKPVPRVVLDHLKQAEGIIAVTAIEGER
ncbi:MAG: L-serine ammonia-lyase, iron-sulfur-dependent subunit beta [Clostridia bacterium]|nr:L-serine ammonia-lyase, iron-sulfur-dependent subunit beta [Clostridia bacterium]